MKAKVIAAIIGVSLLSVALAFGITFIVQSSFGQPIGFSLSTPTNRVVSIVFTPTPDLAEALSTDPAALNNDCTFPIDIWLQYPQNWSISSYPIGGQTYTREQLIEQITNPLASLREELLAQSIAVVLNQQNGADVTAIRNTFSESISWLAAYPQGSIVAETDLRKAETLFDLLEKFNTGQSGSPACDYRLSDVTPVSLPTRPIALTTSTATLRPTSVYLPTWTLPPTPRPREPAPTRRPVVPTSPPPPPPTDPPPPPPPPATEVPTEAPTEPPSGG